MHFQPLPLLLMALVQVSESAKLLSSSLFDTRRLGQDIAGHNGYPSDTFPFGYVPKSVSMTHLKRDTSGTATTMVDSEGGGGGVCAKGKERVEEFACGNDYDCYVWDNLHNGLRWSDDRNAFHISEAGLRYQCVNNRCSKISRGNEGDACVTGLEPFRPQCNYPFTCASNVCQRPLAAGCGPCVDDVNSCMPGTVCDSVTNTCAPRLQEGSKCVYSVEGILESGNNYYAATSGAYSIQNQTWTTRHLSCEWSQVDLRYDPTLTCDTKSGTCKRNSNFIHNGNSCDLSRPNGGCDSQSFCNYNYASEKVSYVCQKYAHVGETCDRQTPCSPELLCNGQSGSGTCIKPFSVAKGGECGNIYGYGDVSGVCKIGLKCNREGLCDSIAQLGDACTQSKDCSGTNLCIDSVCALPRSQVEGGRCSAYDTKINEGPCQDGFDCIDGTCSKILGNACFDSYQCGASGVYGPATCLCNATMEASTCQLHETSDSLSPLFVNVNTCLEKVGITVGDMMLSRSTRHASYDALLCCLLGTMDESTFGDPWISNDIVLALFGYDNKQLSCEDGHASWVRRDASFCELGADYDLAGLKSLAKIDGAAPYQGRDVMTRMVSTPPAEDPTTCGQRKCSGRGVCTTSNACSCNDGAWGMNCEFSYTDRQGELNFLTELYVNTRGEYWVENQGWLSGSEYCNWFGVTCNANKFIVKLDLQFNNLRGRLPESIGNLTNIEELRLNGNFLVDSIPETLYTGASNLRVLDLSQNALTGALSNSVYFLEKLEILNLANNFLTGEIPWSFGYLTNARVMLLNQNNFVGNLPWSTVNLVNVTNWDLTSNNFSAGTYLPSPLCPSCDRTYSKCDIASCHQDECAVGNLLACATPRSFDTQRNFTITDRTLANLFANRPIVRDVPEQCIYRFN